MTVYQKVSKSYFQSQFWMSKINQIKKYIYLRISIWETIIYKKKIQT